MKTLLLTMVTFSATAWAQPDRMRERIREQWGEVRLLTLQQKLGLDDAQTAKLRQALVEHDRHQADVLRRMHEAKRELRQALQAPGKPDDARLNARIDELLKGREEMVKIDRERVAAMRKLLPVDKQARLVLLLPRLERKFRRMIDESHEGRGKGYRGGKGGPPWGRDEDDDDL